MDATRMNLSKSFICDISAMFGNNASGTKIRYKRKGIFTSLFTLFLVSNFLYLSKLLHKTSTMKCKKPPPISDVMNPKMKVYKVTDDPLEPLVFEAVVLSDFDKNLNHMLNGYNENNGQHNNDFAIFIFAQGLYRHTKEPGKSIDVDVVGCKVGENVFKIAYEDQGTYACLIPRVPDLNDELTLIVSNRVFKEGPPGDEDLAKKIKSGITERKLLNGLFKVNSQVRWNGQMDREKTELEGKYEKCLMMQERLFPELVLPWVDYHLRLGFDQIYIYDNKSPINLTEHLKDRENVEVILWPWARSQYLAQSHFLLQARRRCHWAALVDVDEYIALRPPGRWTSPKMPQKGALSKYLKGASLSQVSQVVLDSITMGSSGHLLRPNEPPAEAYIHARPEYKNTTKGIVYVPHSQPAALVHFTKLLPGAKKVKTKLNESEITTDLSIGLIHFPFRSWEEYIRKGQADRASFDTKQWDYAKEWRVHLPSPAHLQALDEDKFEHFRDIYRTVLKQPLPSAKIIQDYSKV